MTEAELNVALTLESVICDKERRLEMLRRACSRAVLPSNGVRQNTDESSTEAIALQITDTERAMESLRIGQRLACAEIANQLGQTGLSAVEYELMTLRYVRCKDFSEIGAEMRIPVGQVYKLHREALKKIIARESTT